MIELYIFLSRKSRDEDYNSSFPGLLGFLSEFRKFSYLLHLLAIGIGGQETVVVRMRHDLSLDRRSAAVLVAMGFHEVTPRITAVVVVVVGGGGGVVVMVGR